MKITLKKIGVINSGSLQTKPLMIFCGANNTGKTYAMYVLYGLLSNLLKLTSLPITDSRSITKDLMSDGRCEIDIIDVYKKNSEGLVSAIALNLTKSLDKFFNSASGFSESEVNLTISDEIDENCQKILKSSYTRKTGWRPKNRVFSLRAAKAAGGNHLTFTLSGDYQEGDLPRIEYAVKRHILRAFFNPNASRAFLLPAERSGINVFQKELVAKRTAFFHGSTDLFDDVDDLNMKSSAKYPLPIADYIDFLNESYIYDSEESVFSSIASELEKNLLGGTYRENDEGIMFTPSGNSQPIDLHLSSSTVKTFYGLWYYLRHIARKQDWLMIDEPELSLHPDNQRKIARVLTSLANEGVNVVISTHSDYIIKEINNLIMLNGDFPEKSRLMEKFNYSDEILISKDKIAAYDFSESTISPMEIDAAEGIISDSFDNVINSLNSSSDEIYHSLNFPTTVDRE